MLNSQINLEKITNKDEIGVTILNCTTYYKANEMKTVCIGIRTDSEINRINFIIQGKKNLHIYSQLIINKDVKTIQWGKTVFSTNDVKRTEYPHTKE